MESIKFINGIFTPSEAHEVLLDAINKKINFYTIKNFRSQVHHESPDPEAQMRMEELMEAKDRLLSLIQAAKESNNKVVIESAIQICFESKEHNATLCLEAVAC